MKLEAELERPQKRAGIEIKRFNGMQIELKRKKQLPMWSAQSMVEATISVKDLLTILDFRCAKKLLKHNIYHKQMAHVKLVIHLAKAFLLRLIHAKENVFINSGLLAFSSVNQYFRKTFPRNR